MSTKALLTALGTLALCQAQTAAAITFPGCLDRTQAENLVTFTLPVLIEGVATKCRPSLPGTALLAKADPGARYQRDADAAWPGARKLLERAAGNLLEGLLTEDGQRIVVEQAVSAAIVEKVAVKDCAMIDQALTALAPLPGRNIAQTVVIAYDLFSRSRDDLPFRLCAAGEMR